MKVLSLDPLCNPACRACHYKHLDYSAQLLRKQAWAELQLDKWKDVLREILPAPQSEQMGYRTKTWLRAEIRVEGTQDSISFGMFRSILVQGDWKQEFISWDTCPLHTPSIQLLIQNLKKAFEKKLLLQRESGGQEDFQSFLDLLKKSLAGVWLGSNHVVVVARDPALKSWAESLNWSEILVGPFDHVWFHANPQVGKKIFGHHAIELIAREGRGGDGVNEGVGIKGRGGDGVNEGVGIKDEFNGHPIRAFRQIAQTLLKEARNEARSHLLQIQPKLVLDLYCGTGDLSLLLPPTIGWVGVELARDASRYASTLRDSRLATHMAYTGTVEDRLRDSQVLKQIEGVYSLYLNPPRSGLSEKARKQLLALILSRPPTTVVYLSCSASSLARDLEVFVSVGYRVELMQPYDFFPQTEHFETLAVLRKIGDGVRLLNL